MLHETIKTNISITDAAAEMRLALSDLDESSVAILLAQLLFETANFKSCYNYNVGNAKVKIVKGVAQSDYCMYSCSEILNGKLEKFEPPHQQTWFKSFETLYDAIDDYLKILKSRWPDAIEAAKNNDIVDFCKKLKNGGSRKNLAYYTDTVDHYIVGIQSRLHIANAALSGKYFETLKLGSTGENVKKWQEILTKNCFHELHVDGIFGVRTHELTKYVQEKHGLKPDGIVGVATWGEFT